MLEDSTGADLFAYARSELGARFDETAALVHLRAQPDWHTPRESLWHALGLLVEGNALLAERIIDAVLATQELRDEDPHYGNFRWFAEDPAVVDLNAVEFALEGLTHILLRFRDQLSTAILERIQRTMRLAFQEVARLDVHWTYTNIYLLDVHNSILAGELLRNADLVARGTRRLREWAEHTQADGAPNEFNSATYSAVQINALAAIVQFTRDDAARSLALQMEELLWRHVASHFHVPTMQLAGPHSRAYRRDVVGAPDFLKVLLYRLLGDERLLSSTPYYDGDGREGDTIVALTEYHCPPDALEMLRAPGTREVRECASKAHGMELNTYIAPEYALGTMTRPYGVGEPPEPWPGHNACILYYTKQTEPGYGVLYTRYLVNDRRVGGAVYPSSGESVDLWEEGAFRTAQHGGDAIVAYGLLPRGQKAVHSLCLDVRAFGPGDGGEITAGAGSFDGDRLELAAGETVVIADGDVLIGIRIPEPTRLGHGPAAVLWRDGQETVLSIYNYDGPPKQFWEYRTLSGPFFKGNVCNGFVMRVAPRSEHASVREFREALESLPLTDSTDASVRTVRFADVELQYDLRAL